MYKVPSRTVCKRTLYLGHCTSYNLNHLESMYIRIVVVQDDGIVSVHFGPAFDAGDDRWLTRDLCYFLDSPGKLGADEALVDEFIVRLQPAFGKPLRHAG